MKLYEDRMEPLAEDWESNWEESDVWDFASPKGASGGWDIPFVPCLFQKTK